MAHGTKINGTAYGITGGKCLVGGTAYAIKKGRTLIGGTGYDISFGTPLSSYSEGDIIYFNESGSPIEFYIGKHDYESGLNGAGRTLVFRKDCFDERQWNAESVNSYASSDIDSWLNGTYKNILDVSARELIVQTTIRYTPGYGEAMSTLARDVFLLSAYELGFSHTTFNNEGTTLPNATNYKIAKLDGSAVSQWTRSASTNSISRAVYISSRGVALSGICYDTYGSRPAFCIPSSVIVPENKIIV